MAGRQEEGEGGRGGESTHGGSIQQRGLIRPVYIHQRVLILYNRVSFYTTERSHSMQQRGLIIYNREVSYGRPESSHSMKQRGLILCNRGVSYGRFVYTRDSTQQRGGGGGDGLRVSASVGRGRTT